MNSFLLDKNGREIMPGDTLKIFHFIGVRRKKHFMYKYVMEKIERPPQFPILKVSHLNLDQQFFHMIADGALCEDIEILQGYGADGKHFTKRPKLDDPKRKAFSP